MTHELLLQTFGSLPAKTSNNSQENRQFVFELSDERFAFFTGHLLTFLSVQIRAIKIEDAKPIEDLLRAEGGASLNEDEEGGDDGYAEKAKKCSKDLLDINAIIAEVSTFFDFNKPDEQLSKIWISFVTFTSILSQPYEVKFFEPVTALEFS